MLTLVPPTSFSAAEIEEFRQEFAKAGIKIHGGEGLRRAESAEQWLKDRPWLHWPNNFVFFSYDTECNSIIGCVRITTNFSGQAVILGAYNVGYAIRPSKQNQGYGTKQLKLALAWLKSFGYSPAMMAASADNPASWKAIEKCGGKLVAEHDGERVYTVDISQEDN